MLLVVSLGSLVQGLSFGWGLLATEFLLILLPALLFLRFSGLPLRQALRLNPISPGVGLAALMIGAGAMLVNSLISGIMAQITGYSVSMGPAGLPSNALDATLVALGLVIAAPLCEEVLFRGAILGAYRSTYAPKTALLITGLLFVFYHLQLQGAVALLPIAFLVGYVAWRANSLYASMLTHFANNALSAILLLTYALRPETRLPYPSLPAGGVGLLLIAAGLFLLNRLAPRPGRGAYRPRHAAPRLAGAQRTAAGRRAGLPGHGRRRAGQLWHAGAARRAGHPALRPRRLGPTLLQRLHHPQQGRRDGGTHELRAHPPG